MDSRAQSLLNAVERRGARLGMQAPMLATGCGRLLLYAGVLLLPHLKIARFGRIGMEQLWNRGGAIGGKGSARRTPKDGLN